VTARRSGGTWYIGGISAKAIPNIRVPLTFLPPGRFKTTLWRDGTNTTADPNLLAIEISTLASTDWLQVGTADGGGFAAELVPARDGPDAMSTAVNSIHLTGPTW
jgi:alpha-glucosidase